MRRALIAALVILLAWIALKDLIYAGMLGASDSDPQQPDYSYEESWLQRPDDAPPGGWEEPWGVDVFVLPPPQSTPAPKGLQPADSDKLRSDYRRFLSQSGLDARDMVIYAPAYRSPSPATTGDERFEEMEEARSDVSAALRRYLSADNRDRGLVILAAPGSEPLLNAVLLVLPDSHQFRERFGGVILPDRKLPSVWRDQIGTCSPAFDGCALQTDLAATKPAIGIFIPELPRPKLNYSAGEDFLERVDTRLQALTSWLDLNATKPAEPFDSWAADEVVDVAPIRRPNQDVDISGERGD